MGLIYIVWKLPIEFCCGFISSKDFYLKNEIKCSIFQKNKKYKFQYIFDRSKNINNHILTFEHKIAAGFLQVQVILVKTDETLRIL